MKRLPLALASVAGAFAFVTPAAVAVQAPTGGAQERPEFDSRDVQRVDADTRVARGKAESRLGELGRVDPDPQTGGVGNYMSIDGFLTGPSSKDAADVVLDYVGARSSVFGLDTGDLDALSLQARDVSPDGFTHLRWVQMSGGIPSYDSGIEGHVDGKGRLIAVQGGAQPDLKLATADPAITATQALAAAREDARGSGVSPASTSAPGAEQRTAFATGERASLVAFATGGDTKLAWAVTVEGEDPYLYRTIVDAATGAVLHRTGLTEHLSEANTVDMFPGTGPGQTFRVQDIGADPEWLNDTAGDTRLAGNNTHTYSDRNANNVADGGANDGDVPAGAPDGDGGPDWLFSRTTFPGASPCPPNGSGCAWDSTSNASQDTNRAQAAATQFVQTNRFHDWLLGNGIGFDEASGNFEQVNSSGQGVGGDRVLGEANDGAGLNNANFSTPVDGSSPRMQMFMWSIVDVNGGEDATVIAHEYTHGLTNRLVTNSGGGGTIGASPQGGAMGEAYSDFYAMDWLAFQGFVTDDPAVPGEVAVGKYVFNNADTGIRSQAMDCATDQAGVSCTGDVSGGYEFPDIVGRSFPHEAGEAWGQILWQFRQRMAASDGNPALSVAEHTEMMQIITGGLRLAPDGPNFVTMRDAMLQQAAAMGGARYQMLWEIFVDRDLGVGATTDGGTTAVTGSTVSPDGLRHKTTTVDDDFATGGDGDGNFEPGETIGISEVLENIGFAPETPITGVASTSTPGATIGRANAAWPAIPGSLGSAANLEDFTLTVPPSASCTGQENVAVTLDVTTPDGPLSIPVNVPVGTAPDYTVGPATTGAPIAIPDNNPAGVSKTITVPSGVTIADLNVRINITHTWIGDLIVTLQKDAGTPRVLIDRPGRVASGAGFNADNFTNTVLDDEAVNAIETTNAPPYTGAFRPNESLDVFDGQSTTGTWTINVADVASADTGNFIDANLNTPDPTVTCPVTRPTATTGDATAVTSSAATLNGTAGAGPTAPATGTRFVYGTTEAYGSVADASDVTAESGESKSVALSGLQPSTTYHYRLETLRGGTLAVPGADRTFTTPAPPPPPPTPTPDPGVGGNGGTVATPGIVPGPGATPAPGPGSTPDPGLTAGIKFTGTPKRITLSSKGTFGLRFGATGGTKGTLSIKATVLGKKNKKTKKRGKSKTVTLVSGKAFTADSKGNVVFKTVTSSKSGFRKLPKATKSFSAVLQVKVGSKTFTHKFTFRRAKVKTKKR